MLKERYDLDPHTAPQLEHSALVVIDMQVDFVDPGSVSACGTPGVLPEVIRLLRAYRRARLPIVHSVRLYDGIDVDLSRRTLIANGSSLARPGTPGSQIVSALQPAGGASLDPPALLAGKAQEIAPREWALWKPRWGAFHRTVLDGHLRGLDVTTVVVVGCHFPSCPRAAVYGASERDYRVLIASDAVSGLRPYHLEEADRIGAHHATSSEITARV